MSDKKMEDFQMQKIYEDVNPQDLCEILLNAEVVKLICDDFETRHDKTDIERLSLYVRHRNGKLLRVIINYFSGGKGFYFRIVECMEGRPTKEEYDRVVTRESLESLINDLHPYKKRRVKAKTII